MSVEPPAIIRMTDLERIYGGPGRAAALNGIDLSIRAGEFVAIVGRSGSGKSTLLNLLGLLDTPTSGNYWVDGVPTSALTEQERDELRARTFGFVFQDSHMLLKESAGRNTELGLLINEVDPQLRSGIVARALASVGMFEKADELARNLSGGERQRVAIARATATAPRILLADEPTGALDTVNAARVIEAFRELNYSGVTVVLVTHDAEIAASADRIITLSDGHVASDRSGREGPQAGMPAALLPPCVDFPAHTQSLSSRALERLLSAISSHTVHLARAVLLLIAFAVGAAGLVTATGLSQTAAGQITARFASDEQGKFYVLPKGDAASIRAELGLAADAQSMTVAGVARERLQRLEGAGEVGLVAESNFDGDVTLLSALTVPEQPKFRPKVFVADGSFLELQGVRVGGNAAGHNDALLRPERRVSGSRARC